MRVDDTRAVMELTTVRRRSVELPESCKRVADLCTVAEAVPIPQDALDRLNALLAIELMELTRPLSAETMMTLMRAVLVEDTTFKLFVDTGIDQLAFLLEMEQTLQDPDQLS